MIHLAYYQLNRRVSEFPFHGPFQGNVMLSNDQTVDLRGQMHL